MQPRETLKLIYKAGMTAVTAALAIGAVAAWWYSTPGNGLLLVAGILGILALITGLSISKLDDQDARADTYRGILDDIRTHVGELKTVRPGPDGTVKFSFGTSAPVTVDHAEPDVHRVDEATLEEARRMASEGRPIDEICRVVDPQFDARDPAYQAAFRKLTETMIAQA